MSVVVSWQAQLRHVERITPTARLVLGELARLADCRGVAIVRIDYLVSTTGRSRRSVFRAIGELEHRGVLSRHARRCADHQCASRFELHIATPAVREAVSQTVLHAKGQMFDVSDCEPIGRNDNEMFRNALLDARAAGWRGDDARRLGRTLFVEGPRQFSTAVRLISTWGVPYEEALAQVLADAWETLHRSCDDLVVAKRPWALWTSIVYKRALKHVDRLPRLEDSVDPTCIPDGAPAVAAPVMRPGWVGVDDLEGILSRLVGCLAAAGMDETIAWAGTLRIVELAVLEQSRRHTAAGTDVRLADLGIPASTGREWMTLLVGSRRGSTRGVLDLTDEELAERCHVLVEGWKHAA